MINTVQCVNTVFSACRCCCAVLSAAKDGFQYNYSIAPVLLDFEDRKVRFFFAEIEVVFRWNWSGFFAVKFQWFFVGFFVVNFLSKFDRFWWFFLLIWKQQNFSWIIIVIIKKWIFNKCLIIIFLVWNWHSNKRCFDDSQFQSKINENVISHQQTIKVICLKIFFSIFSTITTISISTR